MYCQQVFYIGWLSNGNVTLFIVLRIALHTRKPFGFLHLEVCVSTIWATENVSSSLTVVTSFPTALRAAVLPRL